MMRLRLSTKLGLLLFVLFSSLCLLLLALHYVTFSRSLAGQAADDILQRSRGHADALGRQWGREALNHVAEMERQTALIAAVVDRQGRVLAQSEPLRPDAVRYLKVDDRVLGHPEGVIVTRDWRQEPYIVVWSPVFRNGQWVATVVLLEATEPLRRDLQAFKLASWVAIAIMAAVSMVLTVVISKRLTRPLLQMTAVTSAIAKGDYSQRVDVRGSDEVALLAASINRMADNLQAYRAQQSAFLTDVSHELRTPLTYIQGYSEALTKGYGDEAQRRVMAETIHREASRLTRLLQDLFALVRMEEPTFSLERKPVNLRETVEAVVARLTPAFEAKGVAVRVEEDNPLWVEGDGARLEQVWFNLLDNALRHTPPGGQVTVSLRREGGEAVVAVRDTGEGIPPEDLPRIWERLYRVDKSRSRARGGAGLGLAIVKRIVELHGGWVGAESEPGKGATFIVRLPLH
ncbi:MAG TPA: ATP-binding protein [Calditerricola sp.]